MGKFRTRQLNLSSVHALTEPGVDAPDAFHLSLGRETFVETFGAKLSREIRPGFHDVCKNLGGTIFSPRLNDFAVANEIAEHAKERLQGYVSRKHEFVIIAPNGVHDVPHRFEIIS